MTDVSTLPLCNVLCFRYRFAWSTKPRVSLLLLSIQRDLYSVVSCCLFVRLEDESSYVKSGISFESRTFQYKREHIRYHLSSNPHFTVHAISSLFKPNLCIFTNFPSNSEPQTYMFGEMRSALGITKSIDILDQYVTIPKLIYIPY